MKLIVGLGNPGSEYTRTRHNVGFMILDYLASQWDASFTAKNTYRAHLAEHIIDGEKVLLIKPQTYYNLSGEAVQPIAAFYKVAPEDILIIHDDIDLPLGTIRTRVGGSSGGNNGIKSISTHVGEATARLRIGTGAPAHPDMDTTDHVLGTFTADENTRIQSKYPEIETQVRAFIRDSLTHTTIT